MAFLGNAVSASIGWLKRLGGGAAVSTLLQGLVSYWPLDEVSGTRYDVVGSNHLTDTNTVGSVLRGPEGTVASFVKVNSEYLSLADSDAFTPSGSFSVSAWIYPTTSNAVFFVAKEETDPTSEWSLLTGAGGELEGRFWGSGGLSQAVAPVGMNWVAANLNRWWLATYVYDADASTVTVYLNNDAGSPVATNGTLTNRAGALTIGGGARATYEDNKMAGVGFWTRALSAGDIESLVAAGNGLRYADLPAGLLTGLVSWWELDEVSGVRYDSHGSNDLTDNNTVGSVNSGPKGVVADFEDSNAEELTKDSFVLPDSFTITGWANWDVDPTYSGLLQIIGAWVDGTQVAIYPDAATYMRAVVGNGAGGYFYADASLSPAADLRTCDWVHYCVWYDAADKKIHIALNDGVADNVGTAAALTGSAYRTPATLRIGRFTPVGVYFDGRAAATTLHSRVLTAGERTSLFNSGRGKRYADLTTDEKVGLVSYWNLDEGSGVRYDSHGTNDLTDNNTVTSVINAGDAMDGAAASFVAANSEYLSTTTNPFSEQTTVSCSMWFKRTGTGGTYPALLSSGIIGRAFELYSGNSVQADVYLGLTNSTLLTTGPYSVSLDAWHHLYASYDDGAYELYIDNVQVVSSVHNSGPLIASSELEISGPFYYGSFINGQIDEVAIWSRVLTADERAELYALGRGKYYDFAS